MYLKILRKNLKNISARIASHASSAMIADARSVFIKKIAVKKYAR